jgi:hypothetical protein
MPQALQREHLTFKNMKFINFFHFWKPFLLILDPDCESGSGFGDPIESGSNADPDPKHCQKVLNPAPEAQNAAFKKILK